MLYQVEDNSSGIKTVDTDHLDYDRLSDFLGLRKEGDREAIKKIIMAYEFFPNPDLVRPFLSKDEIATKGEINFAFYAGDKVKVNSDGRLSFGTENSFCELMNKLVEAGLLERKLKEEEMFGETHHKPVYGLNPRKLLELSQ